MLQYAFEIEQGVLLWADERAKQLNAQKRAEEERKIASQIQEQEAGQSSDGSEPEDEWLASANQSAGQQPNKVKIPPVVPKRPAKKVPIQPVIAGITSDILTPTPINPGLNDNQTQIENKNVDVTLFEKEDDPFDMFERQTLNDFEELKSVFSTTADTEQKVNSNNSGDESDPPTYENVIIADNTKVTYNHSANGFVSQTTRPTEDLVEDGEYVQLQEQNDSESLSDIGNKQSQIDFSKLPPISQSRTFLADKIPLPPISGDVKKLSRQQHVLNDMESDMGDNSVLSDGQSVSHQSHGGVTDSGAMYSNMNVNQPIYENTGSLIHQNQTGRDLNVNRYSRNDLNSPGLGSIENSPAHRPTPPSNYVNVLGSGLHNGQTGLRNALSSPDIASNRNDFLIQEDDNQQLSQIYLSRSPPPRPSSQQVNHRSQLLSFM